MIRRYMHGFCYCLGLTVWSLLIWSAFPMVTKTTKMKTTTKTTTMTRTMTAGMIIRMNTTMMMAPARRRRTSRNLWPRGKTMTIAVKLLPSKRISRIVSILFVLPKPCLSLIKILFIWWLYVDDLMFFAWGMDGFNQMVEGKYSCFLGPKAGVGVETYLHVKLCADRFLSIISFLSFMDSSLFSSLSL